MSKYKHDYERLAPYIFDAHVHVGCFKDNEYFSPVEVVRNLHKLDIWMWAVSSTSTSGQNFDFVRKELDEVIEFSNSKAIIQLWVTPEMLTTSKDLSIYLTSMPIRGLKIHGHTDGWDPVSTNLHRVFAIALEGNLPILLHTGEFPNCEAGLYRKVCEKFEDVTVILGHGRPVEQALPIILDLPNVWVDTAFMSVRDINIIVANGGADKILFGTDFPVDKYFYPKQSLISRYKRRVVTLSRIFGEDMFFKWSNTNSQKVFRSVL